MKGIFIVLEGPDGSGTTTHSKLLAERLKNEGKDVVLTSEPTDGPIGKFIREQLRSPVGARRALPLPASALQLLFTADRAWHVKNVIEPALKEGKTVICDRYILSTLIYGHISGEPLEWLEGLNKYFVQPDKLLVLLPSFEEGMKRIKIRKESDQFEKEEFQKQVYKAYKEFSLKNPEIIAIDTSTKKEQVAEMIHLQF